MKCDFVSLLSKITIIMTGFIKYTIIFITAVFLGSVLTIKTTWETAMKVCKGAGRPPFSEDKATSNGSWVGNVKYALNWGNVILHIQKVETSKICSDCDAWKKLCEFCNNRIQLNGSVASFESFKTLNPQRKYIIAVFGEQTLSAIPPPTQCMVHRGPSHNQYVSCNERFEDGCIFGGLSDTYITICFDVYATTQADMNFSECASQEPNGSMQPQGHVLICLILIFVQVHL